MGGGAVPTAMISHFDELIQSALRWLTFSDRHFSRRGEYPNGSNIKNIRFVMKCTNFVGPFDPFLRLAPGRDLYQPDLGPHGCLEPGGRPGAGRLNGSNGPTKLVHFITKRIFLMLDPFGYSPLRLAPGRDLYQPDLGPHGCLEPGGRPGAGRLNGSNGPTKLVHFITKRIFLMLDPFGYSPLRLAP